MGEVEAVKLYLKGSHDINSGRGDLSQPLQPLRLAAQCAPRVKPAPILQLVPGGKMPAGAPFAQRLIAGVGREEAGRLVRRAVGKVLRERPRIDAAVGLLINKRHNPPFRLPHCIGGALGGQSAPSEPRSTYFARSVVATRAHPATYSGNTPFQPARLASRQLCAPDPRRSP